MTSHLYYTDAYTTEFDATVVAVTTLDGKPALALDRTYFYPTSGGQPNDTGRLSHDTIEAAVVDVIAHDSVILHILAGPVPLQPGDPVHGALDWPRRFDHMQQHSGQHLLSQVFYRVFGWETVSVHFGADESTLDLDATSVTPEQLAAAEAQANDLVYASLPITAYFVDESNIGSVPLRRPPKVTGQIRIVEIAGFDYSACGGTHVRTTAELGPVKLIRQERRRGQTRITFLCGKRAVADYARKHHLLTEIAAIFSTDISQTPALVARGQEQIKELQYRVNELAAAQLAQTAARLVAAALEVGDTRVVTHLLTDQPVDTAKTLANQIQAQGAAVALLACSQGDKATVIFARSDDALGHMGNLLRASLNAFGGNGGGRPEFAQGGGIAIASLPTLLDFARREYVRMINP
jgi:alanyl-tRNA synthetase